MEKPGIDLLHLAFHKEAVYKQIALACQIAKQLSGLNPLSLSNNKNYSLTGSFATKQWLLKMYYLKRRLRFPLFHGKVIFRSQNIQVFVFLTIPRSTKSVTSWRVLAHETRCIFDYIFQTTAHKITKLGQLIDISKGNNCQQSFWAIWRTGARFQILSNLAACVNYSITN